MSSISVNTITDASGGATTSINGFTPSVSNMAGRNRIINGDMRIDQRNAGASVSLSNDAYTIDRWQTPCSATYIGDATIQQSSTAPAGFTNSTAITVTTATATGASDYFLLWQKIEGFNVSDFSFGTANTKSVTISFWVRSSLTGTFGGSLQNGAQDRSYPFTYTINSANTWEYKTVTITGDTTGTWLTNSSNGMVLGFSLAAGSSRVGTAEAWRATQSLGAAGQTQLMETSGATFYITGVQLEEGSVATPFEHRQYGQELALCQRYYFKPANRYTNFTAFHYASSAYCNIPFPTIMRATPSVTVNSSSTTWYEAGNSYTASNFVGQGYPESISIQCSVSGGTSGYAGTFYPLFTASAEL